MYSFAFSFELVFPQNFMEMCYEWPIINGFLATGRAMSPIIFEVTYEILKDELSSLKCFLNEKDLMMLLL